MIRLIKYLINRRKRKKEFIANLSPRDEWRYKHGGID